MLEARDKDRTSHGRAAGRQTARSPVGVRLPDLDLSRAARSLGPVSPAGCRFKIGQGISKRLWLQRAEQAGGSQLEPGGRAFCGRSEVVKVKQG